MLQIGHRGSRTFEGLSRVSRKPSSFDMSLCRNDFCNRVEGFEGIARAYTCERGSGRTWRRGDVADSKQMK